MHKQTLVKKMLTISVLLCLAVIIHAGNEPPAAPVQSDGTWLDAGFEAGKLPAGWEIPGSGRRDVSLTNGCCILNPGKGDNYLAMPFLKNDLDQDFVIEMDFCIPEPVKGPYSLFAMIREGGNFQLVLSPTGSVQSVTMNSLVSLGAIKPGAVYTVAVLCHPDGTYEGTLAGPGIEKPAVRAYAGPDGALNKMVLGNTYGAGVGSVAIGRVRIGRLLQRERISR